MNTFEPQNKYLNVTEGEQDESVWDRAAATCLVAVDGGIATVGGVSIVLRSAAVLYGVSLSPLQPDTYTHKHQCVAANGGSHVITAWWWWWWTVGRRLPGHGLDFQPLLYAVRQGLLVVVFANTGQYSLLVGFILITTGINLA